MLDPRQRNLLVLCLGLLDFYFLSPFLRLCNSHDSHWLIFKIQFWSKDKTTKYKYLEKKPYSKSSGYHRKLYDVSKQKIKKRMWIEKENSSLIRPIYKHNEVLAAIWHFFSFGE